MAKDGRLVAELSNEVAEAGRDYSVPIKAEGLSTGQTVIQRPSLVK